jgi:AcrR family transcriptional regulator
MADPRRTAQTRSQEDDRCLHWLWRVLYSADGRQAICPRCDERRTFHRVRDRLSYSCDRCGWHVHPTAKTLFRGSHLPLSLWFTVVAGVVSGRRDVTARSLSHELPLSPRSAARMLESISTTLEADDDGACGSSTALPRELQRELLLLVSESAASHWTIVPARARVPLIDRPQPTALRSSDSDPAANDPRERILEAACRAAVARGMGGTRVADIAREAGVSTAVVHYHFATKDAVLMEAARWVERETVAERDAIVHAEAPATVKLGEFLEEQRLRNDLSRQEIILYIGLWGRAMRSRSYRAASTRSRHKWRAYFTRMLRQGLDEGAFQLRSSLDDTVESLTAFLDGITIQVLVGHPWLDEERAAQLTFHQFSREVGCDVEELRAAADGWARRHAGPQARSPDEKECRSAP